MYYHLGQQNFSICHFIETEVLLSNEILSKAFPIRRPLKNDTPDLPNFLISFSFPFFQWPYAMASSSTTLSTVDQANASYSVATTPNSALTRTHYALATALLIFPLQSHLTVYPMHALVVKPVTAIAAFSTPAFLVSTLSDRLAMDWNRICTTHCQSALKSDTFAQVNC